jgi:hypothetical protein
MRKKTSYLLVISILLAVIGFGSIILLVLNYGPRRPQTTVSDETLERFQPTAEDFPKPTLTLTPEPTQPNQAQVEQNQPTDRPTASPTPTPEWMVYDQIDFKDQAIEVLINMACDGDQIYLEPFSVVPYSPGLVESGIFYSSLDFSIAWEHLGYYGLWIHSGQSPVFGDLPAYPLQIYIENDARGFRHYPEDLYDHLQTCLIGAEMHMRQGETLSISEVVAAVRVPPTGIDEVSRHPMDLVPYLAENYPDSGFDRMEPPGLVFYFCGRQLSGEAFNSDYDYWTQSRFILGFMPVNGEP